MILDDFHRLTSGPARDSVAWFIDRAPSTFQLLVATRSEPALPLAALRAHGELLDVRADDLGFTPVEADVLLNDRLELGLEPEYVQDLVERTEGWPAGLYLAALSLQGVDDRHAFVSRFGGGSRSVVDFLVDEVLEAHDPETQTLMLRSSILERLSGSLCDAVVEQEGSDERLASLSRDESVSLAARRSGRVVPLPPLVRAAAARRTRAPRARPRADAPPSRIRLAPRPRLGHRGDRARGRGRLRSTRQAT